MLDLDESLVSCKNCIDQLLLDNRFDEACEVSSQLAKDDLCSAHFYSLLLWFKAYLTLEMPDIEEAKVLSKRVLEFCGSVRPQKLRDNFFLKLFFQPNYENLTDEEIHAELIRVEQITFGMMMELVVDTSLFVLVKVSYRMQSCYQMYKSFYKIIESKQWNSDISKIEFKSAVQLGLGTFNLMLSMLPQRVIALLSMIGFSGSRSLAIKLLNESAFSDSFRSFASKMLIGVFECYFEQVFNVHTVAAENTQKVIESGLRVNPNCYWFLIFKGRLDLIKRDVPAALEAFNGSLNLTLDLKDFNNFYTWEILFCNAYSGNWIKANEFAHKCNKNCQWSPATSYYLEASFLYMILETRLVADDCESSNYSESKECAQLRFKIDQLLSEVPLRVRRYAGRRIPIEKYVCEKVEKYQQDGKLVAPAYEIMLILNCFIFIEGQTELIEPIQSHIDRCLRKYKFNLDEYVVNEDRLLLYLLSAVCHRLSGELDRAEFILCSIADQMVGVKRDKQLAPYTALELGLVYLYKRDFAQAQHWFNRCKNDYSHYALELVVQMRIHRAISYTRKLQRELPKTDI